MLNVITRNARRGITGLALIALLSAIALGADKPEESITLAGDVTKPLALTAAKIKTDFAKDGKTLDYTLKDQKHHAYAVPLISLINAATPKLDPKIKNHALHFVVVVEGKDGYMATFALTELTPDTGNREAWLALDLDDKPLSDRDGPANLIIPGDLKPERWVHGVKTIRVLEMPPSPKG